MSLKEKIVFISDADCESGQVLADRLADEGAHLILNSVSVGTKLTTCLEKCKQLSIPVQIVNLNLCSSDETRLFSEKHGTIDVFIYNNNEVSPISVENGEESHFKALLDANVKSAFIATQVFGKKMAAQKSGKIIYVSSIHDEKPTGSSFAYSCAKGALKMLSYEAALELGLAGIDVHLLEMGPVENDHEKFPSETSRLYRNYDEKIPSGLINHDDLADMIIFLSSGRRHYLNGSNIRMDGGFTLSFKGRRKIPHWMEGAHQDEA